MTPVEIAEGSGPLVLAMPHAGVDVPPDIFNGLNANGQKLADTDWHIDQLYEGLLADAGTVKATFHRYVIDANRDPAGVSLYPGRNTTALVPTTDFDNQPIRLDGHLPDPEAISRRLATFHAPYHAALAARIARAKDRHGTAVLFDCHSIRSNVPFLFEGELPVLNIGTNEGRTCSAALEQAACEICAASGMSWVLNGRFKGGWTTRHYGRPETGVHAIQLEIAQRAYLAEEAPPWLFDIQKAAALRNVLGELLVKLDRLARAGDLT